MSNNPAIHRLVRAPTAGLRAVGVLRGGAQMPPSRIPTSGGCRGFPWSEGLCQCLAQRRPSQITKNWSSGAFAVVRARHANAKAPTAEPNEEFQSECEDEAFFFETQDVCYRGGPVLHDPTIHLIFWQGPTVAGKATTSNVLAFTAEYMKIIEGYFENVAHDDGSLTNVFAIDTQYGEENSKHELVPGEYALTFNKTTDVTIDENSFPLLSKCVDETKYSEGPCLLDSEIQEQVTTVAKKSPGRRKAFRTFIWCSPRRAWAAVSAAARPKAAPTSSTAPTTATLAATALRLAIRRCMRTCPTWERSQAATPAFIPTKKSRARRKSRRRWWG